MRDIQELLDYLHKIWPVSYVVGGFLRQRWFGHLADDLDLIVPYQAISGCKRLAQILTCPWFILDQARDIARVVLADDLTLDVASFTQGQLEQDIWSRDLSINALLCPLVPELFNLNIPFSDLPVIDFVAGIKDLDERQIKGLKRDNFVSDPLRLLRIFRFAAVYGFSIETQTLEWVRELAVLIRNPAPERLMREFYQLIAGDSAFPALTEMCDTGLLQVFFSELNMGEPASLSFVQAFGEHSQWLQQFFEQEYCLKINDYFNVMVSASTTRRHLLILSSFFQGFPLQTWLLFAKRVKMSKKETEFGKQILPSLSRLKSICSPSRLERFQLYRQYGELIPALVVMAVYFSTPTTAFPLADYQTLIYEFFDPTNPLSHPLELVTGHELQQYLNIKPGPLIGKLLLSIQEAQADNKLSSRQEALEYARTLLTD